MINIKPFKLNMNPGPKPEEPKPEIDAPISPDAPIPVIQVS